MGLFLLTFPTFLFSCSDSSDSSGPDVQGEPASIQAVGAQSLSAPAGTIVPQDPTVEVLDARGRPVRGVPVSFQVVAGGGSVVAASVGTDSNGRARGIWILGSEAGAPQHLRAGIGELSAEFEAEAFEADPEETYFGRNQYVEYLPGTLPLVLSAPHGGDLTPLEIPDRSWGATGTDLNTGELALAIRDEAFQETGEYPHVIINHLSRIKLDANREIEEAAQGDPESERAWWEYHTFIQSAGQVVESTHGAGLYVDIHGHGHEIQRVELGYLLSGAVLASSDAALAALAAQTSVRALAQRPGADLPSLLRGSLSLGTLLEDGGFPAVPSQGQPDPGSDPYFSGGYSTARHGSRDGGSVSGVQMECNYAGIRDDAGNREAFAEAFVHAMVSFFPAHFGMTFLPAPALSPIG